MSPRSRDSDANEREPLVSGAPLEPIRVVRRTLKRPDGSMIDVEVPVYPPFELESKQPAEGSAEPEVDEHRDE